MDKSTKRKWILLQILTLARLPISLIFCFYIIYFPPKEISSFFEFGSIALPMGFLVFFLLMNEITDLADGMTARKFGIVSEFGAMLDPYADSISRIIVYWSLAIVGFVSPIVPLSMAIRDISVAYSRIVLTKHGYSVGAKLSGKIKAWVQAIGAFLALFGPIYWHLTGKWTISTLSWIIIIATLVSMIEYVSSAGKAMAESDKSITEKPPTNKN